MAPTHILVTRAGPCFDSEKTPVTVAEMSLSTLGYDSLLSGEFNISEDIDNGWKIKATMQKCVDIRNMESCDFLRSFDLVNSGCADEESEQGLYRMLFHYSRPKLDCPVQAGRYMLVDFPLFTEDNDLVVPESKISTSVFGYTFRLDGFIERPRRQIFCLEARLQLLYIRKHNWIETKHIIKETTLRPPTTVSEEDDE
uniref:SFRICE_008858 n=1 Tax=Spodoptera frugiperda TaxID=7108 RepID=A0A2H1WTH5_SPOFR